MTTGSEDENETEADAEPASRDEVLDLLEDGIREAHRKVTKGRVYDPEAEKVRIQWIRALAYSAGQYRQIKNDEDLEQIGERMDRIEQSETSGNEYQLK